MASASVKSFLIADLLVGQNDKKAAQPRADDSPVVPNSNVSGCDRFLAEKLASDTGSSRDSSPVDEIGAMNLRKVRPCASNSSMSTSEDDRSDMSSSATAERTTTAIKYGDGATALPGSLYQYRGYPLGYPIGASGPVSGLTNIESGPKPYPPGMLQYGLDPFRQNRLMYGRQQTGGGINALLPAALTGMSHGGHLPQGMEYPPVYPNFTGLYGMPLPGGMPGFAEKGPLIGDRDNCRPMYPVSCKRKGGQIRFTNSQTALLEKAFVQQKYLNANDRKKLAHSLGLSDRQVKTWFQNRRAKLRKCKGGLCAESETSGSPKDTRSLSPHHNNTHFNHVQGVKKEHQF